MTRNILRWIGLCLSIVSACSVAVAFVVRNENRPFGNRGTVVSTTTTTTTTCPPIVVSSLAAATTTPSADDAPTSVSSPPAPVLNGKRVLPRKVLLAGIKGNGDGDDETNKIAAVYAILNSTYRRGTDGWEATEYVGVSTDLGTTLHNHLDKHGEEIVAHIRALSFRNPQVKAMQDVALQWREMALQAGADIDDRKWDMDAMNLVFDDDDEEEDEEDDDWSIGMTAQSTATVPSTTTTTTTTTSETIVSPFDATSNQAPGAVAESAATTATTTAPGGLTFNAENVDKVLDEVRPYLIADGGNVAVKRVDAVEKKVYLELEGACGSCPSSTVTMQMGIERVLKENFPDIQGVVQVDDDDGDKKPTELTIVDAVQAEVNRLQPAIAAMGGKVEIVNVDASTGLAQLRFQGSSKVRQGLELALLDLPLVNQVEFVPSDD